MILIIPYNYLGLNQSTLFFQCEQTCFNALHSVEQCVLPTVWNSVSVSIGNTSGVKFLNSRVCPSTNFSLRTFCTHTSEHQTKTGKWDGWETFHPLRGFLSLWFTHIHVVFPLNIFSLSLFSSVFHSRSGFRHFSTPICQLDTQTGFVCHLSVRIRIGKPIANKAIALGCRTTTCTNDASPNEPRQSNRLHGWCTVKFYSKTSMLHLFKLRTQTSFALTVFPSTNNPAFEEPTPNTGCTKIHCKTTMRHHIVVGLGLAEKMFSQPSLLRLMQCEVMLCGAVDDFWIWLLVRFNGKVKR